MGNVCNHMQVILVEGNLSQLRKGTHEQSHLVDCKLVRSGSCPSSSSLNDTDDVNAEDAIGRRDQWEESRGVERGRRNDVCEGPEHDPVLSILLSCIEMDDSRPRGNRVQGEKGHSVDLVASRVEKKIERYVDRLLK